MKTKLLNIFLFMLMAGYASAQHAYFPFNTNVLDQKENVQSQASPSGISFVTDEVRGEVVYFDGVDGNISLGSNAYNFDAVTYNIWFNWTTEVVNQWWVRLFDFGSHVDNNPPAERNVLFATLFAFDDKLQMNIHPLTWAPGTDSVLTSINPIQLNKWYMFTYVHHATGAKLYLDGVLQREITLNNVTPASMSQFDNLWLGKANWPDPLFKGMMDEFTIWDKALTQEEITELYGGETFIKPLESRNALIYSFGHNLRVELTESLNASVDVYGLNGALVYRKSSLSQITDVQDLPTGLYVVKVINNNQMTTQKVYIHQSR